MKLGGGGVGVVKKKESPDFRSPEVDISVEVWATYQLFTEVEVARGNLQLPRSGEVNFHHYPPTLR